MDVIAKSDIFFIITGVSVIILTIVVIVALYYIIKILRNIFSLSKVVKKEGEDIIKDIGKARKGVRKGGVRLGKFISTLVTPKKKRAPRRNKK